MKRIDFTIYGSTDHVTTVKGWLLPDPVRGLQLVAHHSFPSYRQRGKWTVTEQSITAAVSWGNTRNEAIENARRLLNEKTPEQIERALCHYRSILAAVHSPAAA